MKNILRIATGLMIPLAVYACSGDDSEEGTNEEGTGGVQAKGGASNAKATGGATARGGSAAKTSVNGGSSSATGGANPFANGGAAQSGGATNAAGTVASTASAGNAGTVATGPVTGGVPATGGAAATAGAPVTGGTPTTGGAPAAAGAAGTSGTTTPPVACDALCGGTACTPAPQCLADTFGFDTGDALDFCIPRATYLGAATICDNATSGCSTGCGLKVELGTTTWQLTPAATARTTTIAAEATIAKIEGAISVSSTAIPELNNCSLVPSVPAAGIVVSALGTVAPSAGNPALLAVRFSALDADLTQLTLASADPTNTTCAAAATLALQSAKNELRDQLLAAFNARAAELACLECNGSCSQSIACR